MPPQPEPLNRPNQTFRQLRQISFVLDNAIPIPGTSYRIGIDPILGLLPGLGDYVGSAISAYIVVQAARLGASKATLVRMVLNIVLDTLVGNVPLLGDLFDATWKANSKNMALLETHLDSPQTRQRVDWWFVILLLGGLLVVVTVVVFLSLWVLGRLIQALS